MTNKLTKLEEQQRQLNAKIRAEKAKLATQRRKDDTRRKVITGAIVREHIDRFPDDDVSRKIIALLDSHVSKAGDRALLGLAPRTDATKADTAPADPKPEPTARPVQKASPEPEKPKSSLGGFFGGAKS